MRPAITGANGFVGSVIASAYPAALRLVRRPSGPADAAWSFADSAAQTAALLKAQKISHVIHVAWDMRGNDFASLSRSCVAGTARLTEAAAQAGARVIFISTISAFPGAKSAYGRAKLAAEAAVLAAGGTVLRLGLLYGDCATSGGMIESLQRKAKKSRIVPLIGDGSKPQYLLSAETLLTAIRLALNGQLSGVVTLAHPQPIAFRDLLRALAPPHRKPVFLPLPWPVFYAALRAAELCHLPLPVRSDSVLSFVFQNPAPDFSAMLTAGIAPKNFTPPA